MKVIIDFYKSLTPSIKTTVWVTLFILVFLIIIRIKMRHYNANKPAKGIILYCESFVKMMNNFTKEMMGKRWRFFSPYFIMLSIFIFLSNISGLFGFTPPTVSASVTLTLSVLTFILIQVFGLISGGPKKYLKDFATPILLTPLNIISELATPISLAFRLFGNILSGTILGILLYSALGWFAIAVTPVVHVIFDIGFGLIQTLIFVMLSAIFIANKFDDSEFEM